MREDNTIYDDSLPYVGCPICNYRYNGENPSINITLASELFIHLMSRRHNKKQIADFLAEQATFHHLFE